MFEIITESHLAKGSLALTDSGLFWYQCYCSQRALEGDWGLGPNQQQGHLLISAEWARIMRKPDAYLLPKKRLLEGKQTQHECNWLFVLPVYPYVLLSISSSQKTLIFFFAAHEKCFSHTLTHTLAHTHIHRGERGQQMGLRWKDVLTKNSLILTNFEDNFLRELL